MKRLSRSHLSYESRSVDICVVGGGVAGLIAAVSAARRGSSVILLHERPVLGGNASSEVRMWICGARGRNNKETGILEEIQLLNRYRNPQGLYAVWDSVLFEFARMTPGLTTLLNCTCHNGTVEHGKLATIEAWQMTTQTHYCIEAKYFIDCSGDSILAPLSGADFRHGREAREEFDESFAPLRADLKTMGNSSLLQLEETPFPQPFSPPHWAYYFDQDSNLPSRVGSGLGANFWWIELGGLQNTISDAETIRDELYKVCWGVWDYMKNRGPQADKLINWRIRWLGALPGKRESKRYLGEHILTQNDIDAGGHFEDIVAYGGWTMDDHHPAGLYYPGKPNIHHKAPSPYGIPLRSLYSRNVPNLLFAGRNISTTHCALSSTRVMGTCALLGQAAGSAAALCIQKSITPAEITGTALVDLQRMLTDDDCWLPGQHRLMPELMNGASFSGGPDTDILLDGHERVIDDVDHAWTAPLHTPLTLSLPSARRVACLRLIFDSNLNDGKRMPALYPHQEQHSAMPKQLVRAYRVQIQNINGNWDTLYRETDNRRRLVVLPVQREVKAIRLIAEASWGEPSVRLFSFEAHGDNLPLTVEREKGRNWIDVVRSIAPDDLLPPDHGLEATRP